MTSNESNMYWLGYYRTHKLELLEMGIHLTKLKLALSKGFEPKVSPQAIQYEVANGYHFKLFALGDDIMKFLDNH